MTSAAAPLRFNLELQDRQIRRRSTAPGVELRRQSPGKSRPPRPDPLTFPAASSDRAALTLTPRGWRGEIPDTPGQPEYTDSQTWVPSRPLTRLLEHRPPSATRRDS